MPHTRGHGARRRGSASLHSGGTAGCAPESVQGTGAGACQSVGSSPSQVQNIFSPEYVGANRRPARLVGRAHQALKGQGGLCLRPPSDGAHSEFIG